MSSAADHEIGIGYQPILDVARGVAAGYQAQAQAHREPADELGHRSPASTETHGHFDAAVVATVLAAAASLPRSTFVTVPVGVRAAATDPVRAALRAHGGLAGIVLDIVGPIAGAADPALDAAIAEYRAAGALIGVGGHGAPQPELTSIVRLKPAVLRLGRDWVRGLDTSQAKYSAVQLICRLAEQLQAWVLAEGVSSAGELRALAALQVPLAQGPFIGVTGSGWPEIAAAARNALPGKPA